MYDSGVDPSGEVSGLRVVRGHISDSADQDPQRERYAVFTTTDAAASLGVTPAAVVAAARRHRSNTGNQVLWAYPGDSPVQVGLVDADWVRLRVRRMRNKELDAEPHVMLLPVIPGLTPCSQSDDRLAKANAELTERVAALEGQIASVTSMNIELEAGARQEASAKSELAAKNNQLLAENERLRALLSVQIASGRASLDAVAQLIGHTGV